MGLDMYLEKYPRYKNYGPEEIRNFEEWVNWKKDPEAVDITFEEWCGGDESILPNAKDGAYLSALISTKFWKWDEEHRFPEERIYEQVAYWRKANAIHKWFVDKVQDGEDDCKYHHEVTRDILVELLETCITILNNTVLVQGKIQNGWTFKDGKEVPEFIDGLTVANKKICEELLPTQSGFFFGSTGYNQWYIADVRETFEQVSKILAETDFEKEMIFYCSSW